MVAEAEKYKQQEEAVRKKLEDNNDLEGYSHNLKSTLNNEKIRDKVKVLRTEGQLKKGSKSH